MILAARQITKSILFSLIVLTNKLVCNKLPLINSGKGASLTKYENFKKSQANIFLSQLRKNYYSTLRSISLKKSGMNISTDNKKSNFRSTSLNTNKTAILKRNQNSTIILL